MPATSFPRPVGRRGRREFLSRLAAVPAGIGLAVPAGRAVRAAPNAGQTLSYRPGESIDWNDVGEQYVIASGMSYFDCGSLGPTPAPVLYSLVDGYRALASYPMDRERLRARKRMLKDDLARFIGATADETLITRNTTEGLSLVAAGLDLARGDEVLVTDQEHPSGLGPWQVRQARHGVVVREVKVPLSPSSESQIVDLFDRAAAPRTRVVAISHITTYTGLILPVKAISAWARGRGLLTVIDGAHGPGMVPVNVRDLGCDVYAASTHKWLNAPQGTGILYIRRDVQDRIWPTTVDAGWSRAGAIGKYERLGQVSDPLGLAVSAAVAFQAALGPDRIHARILELAGRLKRGIARVPGGRLLTPESSQFSGGITTVALADHENAKLMAWLADRFNIVVDTVGRDMNALRVSTHVYNSPLQIDRLVGALAHAAEKGLS